MLHRVHGSVLACLCAAVGSAMLSGAASAQTVLSGLTYSFTRPSGIDVDGSDPRNQDLITPNVIIARQYTMGIYNAAYELGYDNFVSPVLTEWATGVIPENADKAIAATNWTDLIFTDWKTAYGSGSGQLGMNIVGRDAVVHLIGEDAYLDIRFTSWTGLSGGGFSYLRAEVPVVTPTGDYNGDNVVDAADYTIWRDTLDQIVLPGRGADGDESGIVDQGDYDFWKSHFGEVISPGAGGGATAAVSSGAGVPEPSATTLLLAGLVTMALVERFSPRGPGQRSFNTRGRLT